MSNVADWGISLTGMGVPFLGGLHVCGCYVKSHLAATSTGSSLRSFCCTIKVLLQCQEPHILSGCLISPYGFGLATQR